MSTSSVLSSSCTPSFDASEFIPFNLAIVTQRYPIKDGYGDLFWGIDLSRSLRSHFGDRAFVSLHANDVYEERSFEEIKMTSLLESIPSLIQRINKQMITIVIHGPVLWKKLPVKLSESADSIINIHEYSLAKERHENLQGEVLVSGPGEGEIGMLFDDSLYMIGEDLYAQGFTSCRERLTSLVDMDLRRVLLEVKDAHVFFAYSRDIKAICRFSEAVIKQSPSGSIDICVVGDESSRLLAECVKGLQSIMPEGILQHFEIVYRNKGSFISFSIPKDSNGKKCVRVIFPGFLLESDFNELMISSEPSVLVTGDRSVSLALSLGKVIVYDTPPHKEKFKANLITFAKKVGCSDVIEILASDPYKPFQHPLLISSTIAGFRQLSRAIYCTSNLTSNLALKIEEVVMKISKERCSQVKTLL